MHGSNVKRLQEILNMDDVDGIFGPLTEQAVMTFQLNAGLVIDGIVGPKTWAALRKVETDDVEGALGPVIDRRERHPNPKLYARKRFWRNIIGVTIHQTGCPMPKKPERWDRLNAHYGITREGLIVWVNDETSMVWHAQRLSPSTIGIEIEGNFEGISGNDKTLWKGGGPACYLTKAQLKAASVLLKHIKKRFEDNGAQWRRIYGHRQSKNTRIADPGSEIWQKIAIPWANKLGLFNHDGGPGFCVGSGRPIPKIWDKHRFEDYQ